MLVTKKMLLALTLIGAVVGAGIGTLVTRSSASTSAANTSYDNAQTANPNAAYSQAAYRNEKTPDQIATENSSQFNTTAEQSAYRQGFEQGFAACTTAPASNTRTRTLATYRAPVRRTSNSRKAYYDYASAPRGRSFWQKHRDKLTMAIGTGAGAGIGALIGGKKGAGIGSLVGLGSSALYTYKLRKRSPRNY